jgi:hypothetical protein
LRRKLRVPPIKTFSLDEAPVAITEMANGHVQGKLGDRRPLTLLC